MIVTANEIASRVAFNIANCNVFGVRPAQTVDDAANCLNAFMGILVATPFFDAKHLFGHVLSPYVVETFVPN